MIEAGTEGYSNTRPTCWVDKQLWYLAPAGRSCHTRSQITLYSQVVMVMEQMPNLLRPCNNHAIILELICKACAGATG